MQNETLAELDKLALEQAVLLEQLRSDLQVPFTGQVDGRFVAALEVLVQQVGGLRQREP